MAHIDIVEQTFRDGQQSLWGMRLRGGMLEKVARDMDDAGFPRDRGHRQLADGMQRALLARGPVGEPRLLARGGCRTSELRAPVCQNRIGTFGMTPDCLMDLYVETLIKHGIDKFWIYDCLYNMDEMRRLSRDDRAGGRRGDGRDHVRDLARPHGRVVRGARCGNGELAEHLRHLRRGRARDPRAGERTHARARVDPGRRATSRSSSSFTTTRAWAR